ncbi:MAG: hypothetical protein ACK528_09755 [Alphaproteobacteria bacterium]
MPERIEDFRPGAIRQAHSVLDGEPFLVRVEAYHFVTVRDRFLCDPKLEGPVLLTAEGLTDLLRDAVAVLMDREALAQVKQDAASSSTAD